jgi:hypothetical protein
MFMGLFDGATSSRAMLYYNNLQARVLIPSTLIYTKYVYQKKHLEEDPSRSRSFYYVFLHLPYSILLKGLFNIDLYYIRIYYSTYVRVRTLTLSATLPFAINDFDPLRDYDLRESQLSTSPHSLSPGSFHPDSMIY